MKLHSMCLVILAAILFSQIGHTENECKFKTVNGAEAGICNDDEFTVALWKGDVIKTRAMISANPNLLYSCNFSPSYTQVALNPITFVTCNSTYQNKLELLRLLLAQTGNGEINCESPHLRISAKQCLSSIADLTVRAEVETFLRQNGMN